jgi:hypothetical protein
MPSWRLEEAKMENGQSEPINGMENFQEVKPLDFMPK